MIHPFSEQYASILKGRSIDRFLYIFTHKDADNLKLSKKGKSKNYMYHMIPFVNKV